VVGSECGVSPIDLVYAVYIRQGHTWVGSELCSTWKTIITETQINFSSEM